MSASVRGYWPGITEDERESLIGFDNDCKPWADWIAASCNQRHIRNTLRQLGVEAVLSFITKGMDEDDVDWVSPDQMMKAAECLRKLVLAQDPNVQRLVEIYKNSAIGFGPVHEEFAQDLADVRLIARCAKEMGVAEMTLEINW